MSDTEVLEVVETLREEVAQLRWELHELRRLVQATPGAHPPQRSVEDRRAGLEEMSKLREAILAERGGVPLHPLAPEIAAMREERAAELLDRINAPGRSRNSE